MSSRNFTEYPSMMKMEADQSKSPFLPKGLTSQVYGEHNPPREWYDVSFLVPHEGLRREMAGMEQSIEELRPDEKQTWKILYFCEWLVDIFVPVIHDHHDNEELVYIPWVLTKGTFDQNKVAKDHKALVALLDEMDALAKKCIAKKGLGCEQEINALKEKIPAFNKEMLEHLAEEETNFPPFLKEHCTAEEENEIIQQIVQREGLHGARIFFPSIILAMQEWANKEFCDDFLGSLPGPIRHLLDNYWMPDMINVLHPMRDAPTLDSKPSLDKQKCCKIPFCFPCLV